jgi:hypothetical protein
MSTEPVIFDFLCEDDVVVVGGVGVFRCLGVVLVRPVGAGRFVAVVAVFFVELVGAVVVLGVVVGEMVATRTSRIAAVSARARDWTMKSDESSDVSAGQCNQV